ncbi:putative nucleic acid-binding Zn ribbon protein [Silvimonas terrae]|uniref:Putative nucleic acid-binding Zn ribbon protein n=1 Tax=Silvimonas terrae TaxID=300266 RepID=A0A840RGA6_9NEIS|nr:hypothetical protein [Silvimonas terrae]MBB5192077.1 putative nucleic acid-binding Zn ribbon protein [Silvimonas terrae]
MSREIDQASELETRLRDHALANIRAGAKRETPMPSGICPWCEEQAPAGATFCGTECAQDWQEHNRRHQTAARIQGNA